MCLLIKAFIRLSPDNFNFANLSNNYLKNDYEEIGAAIFKIQSEIGYLYIRSFADELSEANLDLIFNAASELKGLIIDIRDNTGGDSRNAERLFARLLEQQQLTKYEKFKSGIGHAEFSEPRAFYVVPAKPSFMKPIAVLTNRKCFSTCNEFAVYCSYLPSITMVGDNTGGGGSIPFEYVLANGWTLSYSASVTLSKDHVPTDYGVIPDVPVTITLNDQSNGSDPILEKAYQLLQ